MINITTLIIILVTLITTRILINKYEKKKEIKLTEINELDNLISSLKIELDELQNAQQLNSLDKTVNLSNVINKTLDIYNDSNVQIPSDILENLSIRRFKDQDDVFKFIETQRNYWKLECSKRIYKQD